MTVTALPTHELHYAPPRSRRWRLARRFTVLLVISVVAFSGVWWFPRLRDNLLLFDMQQRCMSYAVPPSTAVHTALAASAVTPPGPIPPEWASFYASLSPPGFKSHGTVFVHAMQSKVGSRRLVGVDILSSVRTTDFCWRVIEPGSVIRRARLLQAGVQTLRWDGYAFQIGAGAADPDDPSHFTFSCTLDGTVHAFDGWLRDDDTIAIERRKTGQAITPPAPASAASLRTSGGSGTRRLPRRAWR